MQKDNLGMIWWWLKQERCSQVYVQSPRRNHNKKYVRVFAILRSIDATEESELQAIIETYPLMEHSMMMDIEETRGLQFQ